MKSADTEPEMKHSQRFRYLLKVCALSTATVTFPMLLFAGQNDQGQNNNDQGGKRSGLFGSRGKSRNTVGGNYFRRGPVVRCDPAFPR